VKAAQKLHTKRLHHTTTTTTTTTSTTSSSSSSSWVHKMSKSTSTCKKPGQRQKAFKPKNTEFPSQISQFFLVDGWMQQWQPIWVLGGWVAGWVDFFS
jgi:hypothetical protein